MMSKMIRPVQIRRFEKCQEWIGRSGYCRLGSNRLGVSSVGLMTERLIERVQNRRCRSTVESRVLGVLLCGCKGSGKRTLAKLGGKFFRCWVPCGSFAYCEDPVLEWGRNEMCPEAWRKADMLALCDFWNETASVDYADEMTMLLKERSEREKLTILTANYAVRSFPGMTNDLCKIVGNGLEVEVESVVKTKELLELIRWANDRCGLALEEHVIRHLASCLSGSSGSIIEKVFKVASFAAENPAVPLIDNVIDYALSSEAGR